jgi:hypothetical protein
MMARRAISALRSAMSAALGLGGGNFSGGDDLGLEDGSLYVVNTNRSAN